MYVVVTRCDAFVVVASSIILTDYNIIVNGLMRLLKILEQLLLAISITISTSTISITKPHIRIKPTTIIHSPLLLHRWLVMHRLYILNVVIITHIIQHLQMFIFTIQLILDLHLYLL